MKVNKNIITNVLNNLGFFYGFYYLERNYDLFLNKHLFIRYWYYNKENVLSYFNIQEKEVFSLKRSAIQLLYENAVTKKLIRIFEQNKPEHIQITISASEDIIFREGDWIIELKECDERYYISYNMEDKKLYTRDSNNNDLFQMDFHVDIHKSYVTNEFSIEFNEFLKDSKINKIKYLSIGDTISDHGKWIIQKKNDNKPLYFVKCENSKFNVFDAQKWDICFSFSSFDKEMNLLSILPKFLAGGYDQDKKKYHDLWISFLETINILTIEGMYQIWKNVTENVYFPDHSQIKFLKLKFQDDDLFRRYSDIVLIPHLRCRGQGVDKAFLKWGLNLLITKMISHCSKRFFSFKVEYNRQCQTPLIKESTLIVGQSKIGDFCIGQTFTDTWRYLRIRIFTDSLEVYKLFALYSKERIFLNDVMKFWLHSSILEHQLVITYKASRTNIGFKIGGINERLGQVGHTSFLIAPNNK